MTQQASLNDERRPLSWENLDKVRPSVAWIDNKAVLKFQTDTPVEKPSKFNPQRIVWFFDVEQEGENRALIVSSVSLARALKKLGSLVGKRVRILRQGSGLDVRYFVEGFP